MTPTTAVIRGAVAGAVFVVPAVVLQGLAADSDGKVPGAVAALVAMAVIFGFTLAGYGARRYDPGASAAECAGAGLLCWAVVQAVGLAVALVQGNDVQPLTLVATALLAACLGLVGGLLPSALPQGPER